MSGMTIVTGSPGAGKTALCQRLAKVSPRGLHLPADVFYTFPAHAVSPILPEAHEQNSAVIAAATHAAAVFAARGYEVFLDGIVGPWFLPLVARELLCTGIALDYVILQVRLEDAIRRVAARTGQAASDEVVRHMHAAFEKLGGYAPHALDTTQSDMDQSVVEFTRRRAIGDFAVDLQVLLEPDDKP